MPVLDLREDEVCSPVNIAHTLVLTRESRRVHIAYKALNNKDALHRFRIM